MLIRILILCLLCHWAQPLSAQTDPKPLRTANTSRKAKKPGPEPNRRPLYLIKENTQGTLYGNPCLMQSTRDMGFEYLVQPKGMAGNRSDFERNLHNLGVKTLILFKNGPLWKKKLNQRTEDCRYKTGDYYG